MKSKFLCLLFVPLFLFSCSISYASASTNGSPVSLYDITSPQAITIPEESEPNDLDGLADIIALGGSISGYISTATDVDYFHLAANGSAAGTASFTLNVSGSADKSKYQFAVYNASGTLLGQTTASNKTVSLAINRGPFYVKVFCDNSFYSTTVKYTLTTTCSVQLSVPLYVQQSNTTCGAASARMVLGKFGVSCTENDILEYLGDNYPQEPDRTMVYLQPIAINHFLQQAGISTRYTYTKMTGKTLEEYQTKLWRNVANGYPVQVVLAINSTAYFPYTTAGHYVVIKGLSGSANQVVSIVNDPHPDDSAVYNVPVSAIQSYNTGHSGYIIHVVD